MRFATIVVLSLAMVAPAAAEPFFDIYVGGAFTEDDGALDFEESALAGIRAGVWGEGELPFLGASVDISGFSPDGENSFQGADLVAVPISFLLMARLPLVTSHEFPNGQVHPYIAVGPSLVVSRLEIELIGNDFHDREADLGVDVRAGLDALLTERVGVFAEYRFTHFEPTFRDDGLRRSLELDTHFIQGGLTFRF